jgi:hypothetical protein
MILWRAGSPTITSGTPGATSHNSAKRFLMRRGGAEFSDGLPGYREGLNLKWVFN